MTAHLGWGGICPLALARLRRRRFEAEADRLAREEGCGPIEAAMISRAGRAYIESEARRLATAERCGVAEIALMLGLRQADVRRIVRAAG